MANKQIEEAKKSLLASLRNISSNLIVKYVGAKNTKYEITNISLSCTNSDVFIDITAVNLETKKEEYFDKLVGNLEIFGSPSISNHEIEKCIKDIFKDVKTEFEFVREGAPPIAKMKDVGGINPLKKQIDYSLTEGIQN